MSRAKTSLGLLSTPQVETVSGLGMGVELPTLDIEHSAVPKPADMAAWRRIADLQLENVLARFDDAMIKGQAASVAGQDAIGELQVWVRMSLRAMPTTNAMRMLGREPLSRSGSVGEQWAVALLARQWTIQGLLTDTCVSIWVWRMSWQRGVMQA